MRTYASLPSNVEDDLLTLFRQRFQKRPTRNVEREQRHARGPATSPHTDEAYTLSTRLALGERVVQSLAERFKARRNSTRSHSSSPLGGIVVRSRAGSPMSPSGAASPSSSWLHRAADSNANSSKPRHFEDEHMDEAPSTPNPAVKPWIRKMFSANFKSQFSPEEAASPPPAKPWMRKMLSASSESSNDSDSSASSPDEAASSSSGQPLLRGRTERRSHELIASLDVRAKTGSPVLACSRSLRPLPSALGVGARPMELLELSKSTLGDRPATPRPRSLRPLPASGADVAA
ncbi:hypothetical protein T484DRAFT_1963617 [Baffinella frigidus]|nr:hypothetical protein T484DRAFT_1963617 [Cryptophyta sp. CCMP2293]